MIEIVTCFLAVSAFAATCVWLEYLINGRARRRRILRLRQTLNNERQENETCE